MSVGHEIADPLVCHCYGVTERQLKQVIDDVGAVTVDQVLKSTCAGNGCTACHFRIRRVLRGEPARFIAASFVSECDAVIDCETLVVIQPR